jgi:hypothetical protein
MGRFENFSEAKRFRWIMTHPAEALALLQSMSFEKWRDAIDEHMKQENYDRIKRGAQHRAFRLAERTARREDAKRSKEKR